MTYEIIRYRLYRDNVTDLFYDDISKFHARIKCDFGFYEEENSCRLV